MDETFRRVGDTASSGKTTHIHLFTWRGSCRHSTYSVWSGDENDDYFISQDWGYIFSLGELRVAKSRVGGWEPGKGDEDIEFEHEKAGNDTGGETKDRE